MGAAVSIPAVCIVVVVLQHSKIKKLENKIATDFDKIATQLDKLEKILTGDFDTILTDKLTDVDTKLDKILTAETPKLEELTGKLTDFDTKLDKILTAETPKLEDKLDKIGTQIEINKTDFDKIVCKYATLLHNENEILHKAVTTRFS
jgi:hypothetical protein